MTKQKRQFKKNKKKAMYRNEKPIRENHSLQHKQHSYKNMKMNLLSKFKRLLKFFKPKWKKKQKELRT